MAVRCCKFHFRHRFFRQYSSNATANISAFNLANAFRGFIGGTILDSQLGASMIPYADIIALIVNMLIIKATNKRDMLIQ
ncbi:hypothetical protein VINE108274_23230 [Vibrio neptunius]